MLFWTKVSGPHNFRIHGGLSGRFKRMDIKTNRVVVG